MSAEELTQLIEKATEKRQQKVEGAKQALIEEMETRAAQLGLSLEGLFGLRSGKPEPAPPRRRVRKDAGGTVPVKYRGPEEGQTWSGRGRMPKWLTELEAQGKHRQDYLARN
ncbi:H-NS histone family protein [Roseomonas sp. NAR14]|uniref:H-NS histone family protein n=1 Tax=Roseomonas acroporae TaxID=2937791 RepID=A0A9X1YCH0_9PROT|nr:H-NS histone family protein [Roseomonas acroporae]MCK8787608.1 H-NS histone family protein [Roseomonas acroporae]